MTDEKEAPREETPNPSAGGLREGFQRLDQRDKVVLVGTGLAFILGFLPWYSVNMEFFGASESTGMSGFSPWYGKLYFLTCLATASLIMLPKLREQVFAKLGQDARALSVPILTAATLVLGPVFFLIDTGGTLEPTVGLEMSAGRTGWFYLAFLAVAAACAGAWMKWKVWLDEV